MTTYKLLFKRDAEIEWRKLDSSIRVQFKKKLIERLSNPRVESSRLNGLDDCYKIKLRSAGYRLVYQVRDGQLVVIVVAVGKRERNQVYKLAVKRV
ncbi:type II toxin-antitoxin system RelE family toxin [Aestuariibacter salexigens]|uniref:type II toxin-antitoxin system RelE family toxin n=1 Tax=Aestuariibacter salexigens TaxID=226010 RepID=UPI00047D945C|nr:type II toxin-antitoxin system RelE/ParE family toxin [Aestuariibacter salexigens]